MTRDQDINSDKAISRKFDDDNRMRRSRRDSGSSEEGGRFRRRIGNFRPGQFDERRFFDKRFRPRSPPSKDDYPKRYDNSRYLSSRRRRRSRSRGRRKSSSSSSDSSRSSRSSRPRHRRRSHSTRSKSGSPKLVNKRIEVINLEDDAPENQWRSSMGAGGHTQNLNYADFPGGPLSSGNAIPYAAPPGSFPPPPPTAAQPAPPNIGPPPSQVFPSGPLPRVYSAVQAIPPNRFPPPPVEAGYGAYRNPPPNFATPFNHPTFNNFEQIPPSIPDVNPQYFPQQPPTLPPPPQGSVVFGNSQPPQTTEYDGNNWEAAPSPVMDHSSSSNLIYPMKPAKLDNLEQKNHSVAEEEVLEQKRTLLKQREEYLKKNSSLQKELSRLKDQRQELLNQNSEDSEKFLKENTKLQNEISQRLKAIENVIEMLTGLIGDSLDAAKKSGSLASPPVTVDKQLKKSVERKLEKPKESSIRSQDGNIDLTHANSEETVEIFDSSMGSLKLQHQLPQLQQQQKPSVPNIVHYDPELHWCSLCNVFPKTIVDYLKHLHTAEHKTQILRLKMDESPWHSDIPLEPLPQFNKDAPYKRVPIRGVQFLAPSTGWYCRLCKIWLGDLHCCSDHLRGDKHTSNYGDYVSQNPHWEVDWLSERTRSYERNSEEHLTRMKDGGGVLSTNPSGSSIAAGSNASAPESEQAQINVLSSTLLAVLAQQNKVKSLRRDSSSSSESSDNSMKKQKKSKKKKSKKKRKRDGSPLKKVDKGRLEPSPDHPLISEWMGNSTKDDKFQNLKSRLKQKGSSELPLYTNSYQDGGRSQGNRNYRDRRNTGDYINPGLDQADRNARNFQENRDHREFRGNRDQRDLREFQEDAEVRGFHDNRDIREKANKDSRKFKNSNYMKSSENDYRDPRKRDNDKDARGGSGTREQRYDGDRDGKKREEISGGSKVEDKKKGSSAEFQITSSSKMAYLTDVELSKQRPKGNLWFPSDRGVVGGGGGGEEEEEETSFEKQSSESAAKKKAADGRKMTQFSLPKTKLPFIGRMPILKKKPNDSKTDEKVEVSKEEPVENSTKSINKQHVWPNIPTISIKQEELPPAGNIVNLPKSTLIISKRPRLPEPDEPKITTDTKRKSKISEDNFAEQDMDIECDEQETIIWEGQEPPEGENKEELHKDFKEALDLLFPVEGKEAPKEEDGNPKEDIQQQQSWAAAATCAVPVIGNNAPGYYSAGYVPGTTAPAAGAAAPYFGPSYDSSFAASGYYNMASGTYTAGYPTQQALISPSLPPAQTHAVAHPPGVDNCEEDAIGEGEEENVSVHKRKNPLSQRMRRHLQKKRAENEAKSESAPATAEEECQSPPLDNNKKYEGMDVSDLAMLGIDEDDSIAQKF